MLHSKAITFCNNKVVKPQCVYNYSHKCLEVLFTHFRVFFVYFEWNDKLTASYTSRRRLRIGIVLICGVGYVQKFKNDMLMGKGVQLVRYSERRLVPHDICCFTCFSSSFRLGTHSSQFAQNREDV